MITRGSTPPSFPRIYRGAVGTRYTGREEKGIPVIAVRFPRPLFVPDCDTRRGYPPQEGVQPPQGFGRVQKDVSLLPRDHEPGVT